jgi:hypothetical protein
MLAARFGFSLPQLLTRRRVAPFIISGKTMKKHLHTYETRSLKRAARRQVEKELRMAKEANTALHNARVKANKEWGRIHVACKHARRVLLWGPPGTGKSYIGTSVESLDKLSRLYLTMDTPAAEVRGHYLPNENGSFSWHDGPGVNAWRGDGHRLVIDEIDAASGDTLTLLLALLDDPESAKLTLPTNETIRPGAKFSCVATTNQSPTVLPEALLDRFDVVCHVPSPSPFAFQGNNWNNQKLAETAEKAIYLSETPQRGQGQRPIGLRAYKAIDRLEHSGLPIQEAATLVIGEEASRWLMTAIQIAK